ncbi:MAG: VWA domain-containing protein [Acidobacteria bacterium]|nr:VWA domain-containing protein [Acidobacteriota bacterium]
MSKRLVLLAVVALALAVSAFSQRPTPTPVVKIDDPNEVIKVNSRLVIIPTSVTDANGNAIPGLTANDFKITEEGRAVTIDSVAPGEKVPLEIALLFDVSASTDAMFKFEQDTAAKFLKDVMKPEDRASIYSIGTKPHLIAGSVAVDQASASILGLSATKEATAFFDAVADASDYLRKNAPERSRRVIVVISDGDDTSSESTLREFRVRESKIVEGTDTNHTKGMSMLAQAQQAAKVRERAVVTKALQDADTVFYSINPGGSSYQLNQISVFGQENMQAFASDTGGTAMLPKFLPVDTRISYDNATNTRLNNEMLDKLFRQIANELRSQYLVQYYSEGEFPNGKFVKLSVDVPTHAGSKIRARQGYYVKN